MRQTELSSSDPRLPTKISGPRPPLGSVSRHPRTLLYGSQVAHGLSALHADGGVHRNITARNVYLDEKGRAKLGGYQFLKVRVMWRLGCRSVCSSASAVQSHVEQSYLQFEVEAR